MNLPERGIEVPEADENAERVLVLGLGNLLLRDDGAGVHAIRRFMPRAPRSCLAVEIGTAALAAAHLVEAADKIIAFDAMEAGGAPGTVYAVDARDLCVGGIRESLHDRGLWWILRTLKLQAPEVVVIGVEPRTIEFGLTLTQPVRAAVPKMVRAATAILSHWHANRGAGIASSLTAIRGQQSYGKDRSR